MKKLFSTLFLTLLSIVNAFAIPSVASVESASEILGIPYEDLSSFVTEYYDSHSSSASDVTAENVYNLLSAYGIEMTDLLVYTAESDPNEMLGRPHGYTSKIDATDVESNAGVSIEVFANVEDANDRKEYIDSLGEFMPFLREYSYLKDSILLRLDSAFTPDRAEEYHQALESISTF